MMQELKNIKIRLKNIFWLAYGISLNNPDLPENPGSLLFVCTGNICRSPFAEYLAAKMANNNGHNGMDFISAGLEVTEPVGPPENSVLIAKNFGVDLDGHKSRKLDRALIKSADMVLVMEPWHLKTLLKGFPDAQNKVFLLSLFDKRYEPGEEIFNRYNIADPYGKPPDQFHSCYSRIEICLLELFSKIRF